MKHIEQQKEQAEADGVASSITDYIERAVRLAKDYAKPGCVFSIYQNDGSGIWHKRGEIDGRDMAKILGKN